MSRQKWSEREDEALRHAVASAADDWREVVRALAARGFTRSQKQARDRWLNQLNPVIDKNLFSREQNRILFDLHSEHGNKWKFFSSLLENKPPNTLKNHFFILLRRSVRRARKMLKRDSGGRSVSGMRTKFLLRVLEMEINLAGVEKVELGDGVVLNNPAPVRKVFEFLALASQQELMATLLSPVAKLVIESFLKLVDEGCSGDGEQPPCGKGVNGTEFEFLNLLEQQSSESKVHNFSKAEAKLRLLNGINNLSNQLSCNSIEKIHIQATLDDLIFNTSVFLEMLQQACPASHLDLVGSLVN